MRIALLAKEIWTSAFIAIAAMGMILLQIGGEIWTRVSFVFALAGFAVMMASWMGMMAISREERRAARASAGDGERLASALLGCGGGAAMGGVLQWWFAAPLIGAAGAVGFGLMALDKRWGKLGGLGVCALAWITGGAIYFAPIGL